MAFEGGDWPWHLERVMYAQYLERERIDESHHRQRWFVHGVGRYEWEETRAQPRDT